VRRVDFGDGEKLAMTVVDYLLQVRPAGGTYTPARLLGADPVTDLPGSGALKVE